MYSIKIHMNNRSITLFWNAEERWLTFYVPSMHNKWYQLQWMYKPHTKHPDFQDWFSGISLRGSNHSFLISEHHIYYMRLSEQKSVIRLTPTKVTPSTKMVPMGSDSMLCFSGHLEPSSIDARAQQSFSFSSQNWPHGSRAETRRENDAKSKCEV